MNKYILEIIVFICGATVMIFELAGSRVVAPYLGTSIVVWTSLIGIILGSLSIGYFSGGRIADKYLSLTMLSVIILLGACFIGLTSIFKDLALRFILDITNSIHLGSVLSTLLLFSPASVFLGMVSPYAIRLKLENIEKSGSDVGRMYAISTVGSIVGTFATGFFLIPFFGTNKILFIISFMLILLAILVAPFKKLIKANALIILVCAIGFSVGGLFRTADIKNLVDIDTKYSRYWILEGIKDGRKVRSLRTDPHGTQSAIYIDSPNEMVFSYTKFFSLLDDTMPEIKKALLIGGGAFTYPGAFLNNNPGATIDVVEIDDELINISRSYFNYIDDPRITVYSEDGRMFLNRNEKKYDRIYMDAFGSHASIPFQLTTREAVERIYNSLSDDGIVYTNIISAITGKKGKFLRAELATYEDIFSEVLVYQIQSIGAGDKKQNLMIVARKNVSSEEPPLLNNLWTREISRDTRILTDDYAPVDYYTKELASLP